MASVKIIFFKKGQDCPVKKFLDELPKKVKAKAEVRLEGLAKFGHELRRPDSEYLRDGIYELRWRFQSVNYRILYFFYGRETIILAQGLTKEKQVPIRDIEIALWRKKIFEKDPGRHMWE